MTVLGLFLSKGRPNKKEIRLSLLTATVTLYSENGKDYILKLLQLINSVVFLDTK